MAKIQINNPRQTINGGAKKYYFKVKGLGGPKGDKGDKGDTGSRGPQGEPGNAATVYVGSTTTLEVGQDATVENVGTQYNAVLNFGIPQGPRGPQGIQGERGEPGQTGQTGPRGPQGEKGTNATVYVGTTTTTNPGTQARVYNSGTDSNAVLNFEIPRGDVGPQPELVQTTGTSTTKAMSQNATTEALNGKQNTLTAGANIQIQNGTISATDTTYTAGNGLSLNGTEFSTDTTVLATKSDLDSYYTKTETDTKLAPKLEAEVVAELPTTGEDGKLYLTPKAHTTSTATGNPITATVTEQAGALESFQLDGDTFQQSYTGKNLYYDADGYEQGFIGGNGEIAYSIQSVSNATYIEASENMQYVVSFNDHYGGITLRGVGCYDSNKDFISRITSAEITDGAFQTVTGTAYIRVYFYNNNGLDATNFPTNYISDIQLELGSTPTSGYEPYTGGQPSPSPEYPQQIQTVTGEQTVTVAASLITTDTELENSRLNSNGPINLNISNRLCTSEYIQVEPNTKYLFDVKDGAKQVQAYFVGYASTNGVGIENYPNGANWANPPFSIITGSNCHYVKVGMRFSDDSDITPNDISEIELLTPGTTYPISLGSIELCKLGTYQDYIYKDGEDWKIRKNVKKIAPTGEESYSFYEVMARFSVSDVETGQTAGIISTHFMREYANNLGKCYVSTGSLIAMGIPNVSTEAQAQAWVSANRPEFYCELSAPTDTTITDTALIAQLEAIRTASLQNGANTITNTAAGSNLAGDMEIGYYGYNPRNRYDKWLWLDIDNEYEQIGS